MGEIPLTTNTETLPAPRRCADACGEACGYRPAVAAGALTGGRRLAQSVSASLRTLELLSRVASL